MAELSTPQEIQETGSGSTYLKLGDGEKIVGVFVGERVHRRGTWEPTDSGTTFSVSENGKSQRFWRNLYVPKIESVMVWEMGITAARTVEAVLQKYPGFSFEISRDGTGMDTKYTCMPEEKLTKADLEKISSAETHNLADIADRDLLPF